MSILLLASFTSQVRADATVYWDYDYGFRPSTVVISPGEQVTWWNMDPYGFDVRIEIATFNPAFVAPGHGIYAIFNTQGTYSVSSDWGDSGSVIVSYPPSITITNPLQNAVFSAPATFEVKTSTSGNVLNVGFWLDSGAGPELLDYDYEAPFSYGLTNLAAGTYTLTATASDGYRERSDSVHFTVAPLITLSNPRFSGGAFRFDVNGLTVGKTQLLQISINCTTWTSIATNVATDSTRAFTNSIATGGCFYRVLELGAPSL